MAGYNWAKKLNELTEKGGKDLGMLCKNVKEQLFTNTVKRTRVGDATHWKSKPPPGYTGGRLKGNWQVQEFTKATGELDRIDKKGGKVKAEIKAVASEDGVTYFTNNLPYAKKYEEEDAMVGLAALDVRKSINREIRKLRAKK